MSELWFLFFMMYIGVVWITILYKLKQIEKLLRAKTTTGDGENGSPSKIR